MFEKTLLSITDDSGFLAIVNPEKYSSFIGADWELIQLFEHFVTAMNNDSLIIWSVGIEGHWNVEFVRNSSNTKSFREFSKKIVVTNGKLFLTNYEDLTMAAQFQDEILPAKHNSNLFISIDNGEYDFTIRQLFDPGKLKLTLPIVHYEIAVSLSADKSQDKVHKIFWLQ